MGFEVAGFLVRDRRDVFQYVVVPEVAGTFEHEIEKFLVEIDNVTVHKLIFRRNEAGEFCPFETCTAQHPLDLAIIITRETFLENIRPGGILDFEDPVSRFWHFDEPVDVAHAERMVRMLQDRVYLFYVGCWVELLETFSDDGFELAAKIHVRVIFYRSLACFLEKHVNIGAEMRETANFGNV